MIQALLIFLTISQIASKGLVFPATATKASPDQPNKFLKKYLDSEVLTFTIENKTYPLSFLNTYDDLLNSNVCLGQPTPQCFDVILDTGSYLLWVANSQCTGKLCPSYKYYESSSTTAKNTGEKFSMQYATGSTSGVLVKEMTTFFKQTTPVEILFLSADQSSFPATYSYGILGLGRNYNNKLSRVDGSIMGALMNSSAIEKNVFSMKWKNYYDGEFVVGDYPEDLKNSSFANYTTCDVVDLYKPKATEFKDIYWSCLSSGFVYSSTNSSTYINQTMSIVFDSGANSLLGPLSDLNNIGNTYAPTGCRTYTEMGTGLILCKSNVDFSKLPDFGFQVNGEKFQTPASEMYKDLPQSVLGYTKMFKAIFSSQFSFWLIGTPILRHYLVVYDKDKMQVGFQPNRNDLERYSNPLVWIIIIVSILLLIGVGLALYCCCYRKRGTTVGTLKQGLINN